jgi:hypothetical protein
MHRKDGRTFMQATPLAVAAQGLWRAIAGRINLAVGGAALASAIAVQATWYTFAVAGTYVVVLGSSLCRKSLWRDAAGDVRRRPPELPLESDIADPELRDLLGRLRVARLDRIGQLRRSRIAQDGQLRTLLESISDLEESGVRILLAADRLAVASADGAGGRVFTRAKLLATRAGEESDPLVRVELARASHTADDNAGVVAQLVAHQRRLTARLVWILETLDLLSSRLVGTELGSALAELDVREDACADAIAAAESVRGLPGCPH